MADSTTLIKMEGVKKVFYTDEVETHALSEIHLEIKRARIFPSRDLRAAASRRCFRFWGCSIRRPTEATC